MRRFRIGFQLVILSLLISLPLSHPRAALAPLEISSSPNPVGSGAQALGMGGAFIGIADDATAASWNPGGLVQLQLPEASLVGYHVYREEENRFERNPEASGGQSVSLTDLNYASLAYPFQLFNRNMILSLNYQHLYDFTREWDFPIRFSLPQGETTLFSEDRISYCREGRLSAWGLAYAVQVVPVFSVGVTLNFWDESLTGNGWEVNLRNVSTLSTGIPGFDQTVENRIRDEYDFDGMNFNAGFLWRPAPGLTVGGVFKSPFTADLRHENTVRQFSDGVEVFQVRSVRDEELDMPMSYGLGVAQRFSDRFTLSADLHRTEWDDYLIRTESGSEHSPITNKSASESDVDATHHFRIGMEYLILQPEQNYVIPLRAGVFYDPNPSEAGPDDIYGFSLGSGLAWGRLVFDTAYVYRFGNDVSAAMIPEYEFSQDLREHLLYMSLIVHF